jgi:phosphohistidine phosphatase SixA
VLYLVRHADAGSKLEWSGADLARPLSAGGHRQAAGLVARLREYPVARILTSPAERCRQTVAPLARQRRLAVEPVEALGVDGTAGGVLGLLRGGDLEAAVLCTHGEVIARVFACLQANGLQAAGLPRWPKGSTWVLGGPGGRLTEASYLEPLSAGCASPAC